MWIVEKDRRGLSGEMRYVVDPKFDCGGSMRQKNNSRLREYVMAAT